MGVYQGPCCVVGWWWIMPLVMISFCILMMFLMRRRMPNMMGRMMGPPGIGPRSQGGPIGPTESAKEILDKRYVTGEITKEEYDEKKAAISGG